MLNCYRCGMALYRGSSERHLDSCSDCAAEIVQCDDGSLSRYPVARYYEIGETPDMEDIWFDLKAEPVPVTALRHQKQSRAFEDSIARRDELERRKNKASKNTKGNNDLTDFQSPGPGKDAKMATEIAVRDDAPVSPYKNYVRPAASPTMHVQVPVETETGIVMPPLPKHECETPVAVEKVMGKWGNSFENEATDIIHFAHGSVFNCICGKDWYVKIRKVPFHAASYKGQHTYKWLPVRWFHFGRKADIARRAEKN